MDFEQDVRELLDRIQEKEKKRESQLELFHDIIISVLQRTQSKRASYRLERKSDPSGTVFWDISINKVKFIIFDEELIEVINTASVDLTYYVESKTLEFLRKELE
ncbi:hypothetical protein [Paenibacillus eucommiae]|uniref:Acyl-CoA hydrolase n=1 Tax=Paenibacillus eucommiae TaxID=1355755 RepID=A0ABS4JA08_9BACL|nr:hypothetical protein [Paenibacillus eucommiae]MBP1996663.1 acyl-CoA hydrolase [Paenibacillus eucommiae]